MKHFVIGILIILSLITSAAAVHSVPLQYADSNLGSDDIVADYMVEQGETPEEDTEVWFTQQQNSPPNPADLDDYYMADMEYEYPFDLAMMLSDAKTGWISLSGDSGILLHSDGTYDYIGPALPAGTKILFCPVEIPEDLSVFRAVHCIERAEISGRLPIAETGETGRIIYAAIGSSTPPSSDTIGREITELVEWSGGPYSYVNPLLPETLDSVTVEMETDMRGNDYRWFSVADLKECQSECVSDPACYAYTFRTTNPFCWLKNPKPTSSVPLSGYISGTKKALINYVQPQTVHVTGKFDTDMPGSNYMEFNCPDLIACQDECTIDTNCKAYTFRRRGAEGQVEPYCWLKDAQSSEIFKLGYISGIKKQYYSGYYCCQRSAAPLAVINSVLANPSQINNAFLADYGCVKKAVPCSATEFSVYKKCTMNSECEGSGSICGKTGDCLYPAP